MRRDRRYRCAGCLRSWDEAGGSGPVLKDEIWARICNRRPRDILCESCIRERFRLAYRRELRIDDLFPCPINLRSGRYFELLGKPIRVLADWARTVAKAEELWPDCR